MALVSEPVDLGIRIADAEAVSLEYDGTELALRFTDWQETLRKVRFADAVAFKWQRAEDVQPGEQWDGTNIVVDSAWLQQHRDQREAGLDHRHFKFNFNAAGVLEVICVKVTLAD
jgi:hypothetical protein